MSPAANASQAQRWNGDAARRWIAQRERHAAIRQRLTPHLSRAAAISPGNHVLDVGCGCGETTIAVARSTGRNGGVLGLDLSGPMLEVAQRLAAEAGVANIRFVQGDAQVYPLSPAVYDVIISSFGVMFFDDPATAFGNIRGALRPGARLAFLCWQDDLRNGVFSIPLRAFMTHTQLPDLAGDDLFADPRRVTDLLASAGFTDTRIEALHEPARIGSDVADVMAYVQDTSNVRELTAQLDDEVLVQRVLATMAEEFAARQHPDGVWVDAAAWLVTADNG
ncbi:class I SAM-dependent methyltransferase [Micromonospora sp. NPDC005087]|uniref:class I SAM-dependent methyltransferase n=1 Tax=Micromonospora sp. NPDC005087 TaxID=3364225 RepID=UPI003698AD5D